jgi:predicted GH43/DUF377 family glycosyl hydrolase
MKYMYALLMMALIGCADNGVKVANVQTDASVGKILFSLSKSTIPQNIASVTFTLTNSSTAESISKIVTVSTDTLIQVSFNQITIGSWHVKVVAKDSASSKQYSGESDVSVALGQVTQLNLFLNPTSSGTGSISITVNWQGTAPFYDYPLNPIFVKTGAWYDTRGVVSPVVLYDNGKYKMWFMNYGILNGAAYATIGLAESIDGTTWTRVADTVLTPTPKAWDGQSVAPGSVIKENGIYTMYYSGSGGPAYVGMATSQDGEHWTKRPTPLLPNVPNIGLGCVVKANGQYYMYYHTSPAGSIQLATSADGVNFQVYSGNPVLSANQAWEGYSIIRPCVIFENNVFTMVYTDNDSNIAWGLATSTDGIHWVKDVRNPVFSKANTVTPWATWDTEHPFLVRVGSELRCYYTGIMLGDGLERIGYATKR